MCGWVVVAILLWDVNQFMLPATNATTVYLLRLACSWRGRQRTGLMTYRQVILTSYLFPDAKFSMERLQAVIDALGGDTSKLVIDLSCRRRDDKWIVAMNRWQTLTDMEVNQGK